MDIRGKEEKKKEAEEVKAKALQAKEVALAPAAKEAETSEEPKKSEASNSEIKLTDLEGVGQKVEKILRAAGYDTVEKVKALTAEDLVKLEGIGEKTAGKILKSAKKA